MDSRQLGKTRGHGLNAIGVVSIRESGKRQGRLQALKG
jgi:hypothetical protein